MTIRILIKTSKGLLAARPTTRQSIRQSRRYLPGSSSASFANLSSYTDGINGIMVDMFGEPGQITANDFSFAVGTNNAASKWAPAPAPSTVSVRTARAPAARIASN